MPNSRIEKKQLKKQKKRRSAIKRALTVFLFVFLIAISFGGYLVYKTTSAANEAYNELDRGKKSELRTSAVNVNIDPFSVLIMGIEDYSSGGKGGRADTLMVATINPEKKTMKLLSIPRDTRVKISNTGSMDKINHSYNAGKENTIRTVEGLLDIPIDYYATVNFEAFKNTINHLDGITVNVPFDFWEYSDVDREKIYFNEGLTELDGEEALAYARMRKRDPMGDFGRNERQKQIIKAVIEKAVKPSTIFKIDDITKEVGKNIKTNIKISELVKISNSFTNFNTSNIESLKLEGDNLLIDSVYYFSPNEESITLVKDTLKTHLNQQNTVATSHAGEE